VKYSFDRSWCVLLPVLIVCWFSTMGWAQGAGQTDNLQLNSSMITTSSMNEHEILVDVQIWGQVMRPGMYKVPVSTDVVGLISFAGGPNDYAAMGRVKLVRGGVPAGKTFKLNLDRYTGTGNRGQIPMLEAGDVVIVPTTVTHSISVFTGFLSQLAVAVSVYLVIVGKR
jgi:hypothetical protein